MQWNATWLNPRRQCFFFPTKGEERSVWLGITLQLQDPSLLPWKKLCNNQKLNNVVRRNCYITLRTHMYRCGGKSKPTGRWRSAPGKNRHAERPCGCYVKSASPHEVSQEAKVHKLTGPLCSILGWIDRSLVWRGDQNNQYIFFFTHADYIAVVVAVEVNKS